MKNNVMRLNDDEKKLINFLRALKLSPKRGENFKIFIIEILGDCYFQQLIIKIFA